MLGSTFVVSDWLIWIKPMELKTDDGQAITGIHPDNVNNGAITAQTPKFNEEFAL